MALPSSSGVTAFFQAYEQALSSDDPACWAGIYHDSFLFAGPLGARTVKLEDFLNVIPHRAAMAQSLGLTSTRLGNVEPAPLDERYMLAKVGWEMTVKTPSGEARSLSAPASYVLMRSGDGYRIVAQIDHIDLMETLKES